MCDAGHTTHVETGNTYTLNTLEDEEEGEITRVKRERDSGEADGKVYYSLFYHIS